MPIDPRQLFPAHLGEVRDVARLAGGLSGAEVHAVTSTTGKYVLRSQGTAGAAWHRAVALQRLAADAGIAPALVAVDEPTATTISAHIAGVPLAVAAGDPAQRAAAFGSLVAVLARLHAIPLDPALAAGKDILATAREVWDSQRRRPGFPAWAAAADARLAAASATVATDPRRVFCHMDVNPMNALWDGQRIWLLDWEGAGPGHPYLDLATCSVLLCLPDEAAAALVAAQERAPLDPGQLAVLGALRDLSRIVYGSAFLRLVPDLTAVSFADRDDTPTLAECFTRLAAGALSPASPSGQALLGAALLRQCA
jgi:aminoglycoside phosphotransferase (APT) family kinase protein